MAKSDKHIVADILAFKMDYWERLKRNDAYRSDFMKFIEVYNNRDKESWQDAGKIEELVRRLGDHYHLLYPLDPRKKHSNKIISEVVTSGECMIEDAQTDWDGNRKILPIKKESFQRVVGLTGSHDPMYKPRMRSDFLVEGKYLRFLVDIDLPVGQIKTLVARVTELARDTLKDNIHRKTKLRDREYFEDNKIAYDIWDLRKGGHSYEGAWLSKMPREMSPESAKSKGAQHYKKADKLITSLGKRPVFDGVLALMETKRPDLFK